jgi:hypothetical protein
LYERTIGDDKKELKRDQSRTVRERVNGDRVVAKRM